VTFDDEQQHLHREVWQLIPWLVNGTASADEHSLGERHLQGCGDCRDEFALQSRIRAGLDSDAAAVGDSQAAFARLLERIDAEPYAIAGPERSTRRTAERWLPGLVAAVVVQAVGLVAIAAFALQRAPAAPPYTTLSEAAAPRAAATIRLVPAPTQTVGELHAMLAQNALRIVDGEAERPIYALAPTRVIDTAATLERLRARADVLLAEPIAGDAR
jgi:hypothetical protein